MISDFRSSASSVPTLLAEPVLTRVRVSMPSVRPTPWPVCSTNTLFTLTLDRVSVVASAAPATVDCRNSRYTLLVGALELEIDRVGIDVRLTTLALGPLPLMRVMLTALMPVESSTSSVASKLVAKETLTVCTLVIVGTM